MLRHLDRLIGGVLSAVRWLALPIMALLFLQWPLREIVKAYSREANDLGQWLFALFVAASVVAATRAHMHLATDAVAQRFRPQTRATLAAFGNIAALLPWSLFVLASAAPTIGRSVAGGERFSDTGNPGYFIVKLALGVLLALIALQALVDLVHLLSGSDQPARKSDHE